MNDDKPELPFQSSAVPEVLGLDDVIQFNCHKGISCFNACCRQADVSLLPYDVIRLKQHKNLDSEAFLKEYTVPFQMDASGMPGVKLKTDNDGACVFLGEEGCTVYGHRPAACRYYALGLMDMRKTGASEDEQHFFLVQENHCMGHQEQRKISIRDYRREQQVDEYDDHNREWMRIVLRKRSSGPAVGAPSATSFQFFFMCSFDLDRMRRFINSPGFKGTYDVSEEQVEQLMQQDLTLLNFSYQLMNQVFFGFNTIAVQEGAMEKRVEERSELLALRRQAEIELSKAKDPYQAERELLDEEKNDS